MQIRTKAALALLILFCANARSLARAATLGNLAYPANELNKAVSLFNTRANMPVGPGGADSVLLVHGYLVVQSSYDSGKAGGAFHVYDISNPRSPVLVKSHSSPVTNELAEWHMAVMAKVDGKDVLLARSTSGIAFFDFTDPRNPKDLSKIALPGVNGGDYTNTAWMSTWSWPYVYAACSGAGVIVIDAADPANPKVAKQIPTGQLGNFRVGPLAIAGNYLVVTNMDQSPLRASVIDVSNLQNPALLTTLSAPNGIYSAMITGDLLFGGGEGGNYTFVKWSPTSMKVAGTKNIGRDKGGYCTFQDGFGFCGQSADGYHKIDLRDLGNIQRVDTGILGAGQYPAGEGDFDFATVLGNLVFQGNDHGGGSGLLVHQIAPDTTPPAVQKIFPEDQSTRNALTSHVTVFFSDEIDLDSVNSTNLIVRKLGASPLDGVYSHSSTNAVSFGPRQPLEANTTYEVVVTSGGVKDYAGNAVAEPKTIRFSTGATVDTFMPDGGSSGPGPSFADSGPAATNDVPVVGTPGSPDAWVGSTSSGTSPIPSTGGIPSVGSGAGGSTHATGGSSSATGLGGTAGATRTPAPPSKANGGCELSGGQGIHLGSLALLAALWFLLTSRHLRKKAVERSRAIRRVVGR